MPLSFERQRIHGGIGAGSEVDRIAGRGGIQLGARGKALIAQAGDEDLREHDPVARFGHGRARSGCSAARRRWFPSREPGDRTRRARHRAHASANRIRPGRTVLPCRSIWRVFGPASLATSSRLPVARMRSPRMAMESTTWNCASTVTILPWWRIRSAGWADANTGQIHRNRRKRDGTWMEHHTPAARGHGFCEHNVRVIPHLLGHLTQTGA